MNHHEYWVEGVRTIIKAARDNIELSRAVMGEPRPYADQFEAGYNGGQEDLLDTLEAFLNRPPHTEHDD